MMFYTLILLLSKEGVGMPPFSFDGLNNFHGCHNSKKLEGGLCHYCVLFPQQPDRGGSLGANTGVLVCSSYQRPYTKALGKNGILTSHDKSSMHCRAAKRLTFFLKISEILMIELIISF